MSEAVRVVSIEAAPGTTIRKKPYTYGAGHQYVYDAIYVLEDGRREQHEESNRLLRDAKAELASLPRAPKRETHMLFDEQTGERRGLRTTVRLFARV